jgi:hypothetical protein
MNDNVYAYTPTYTRMICVSYICMEHMCEYSPPCSWCDGVIIEWKLINHSLWGTWLFNLHTQPLVKWYRLSLGQLPRVNGFQCFIAGCYPKRKRYKVTSLPKFLFILHRTKSRCLKHRTFRNLPKVSVAWLPVLLQHSSEIIFHIHSPIQYYRIYTFEETQLNRIKNIHNRSLLIWFKLGFILNT